MLRSLVGSEMCIRDRALSALLAQDSEVAMEMQDRDGSSHMATSAFVQHMVLDPQTSRDPPGFKVRAKPGLAGCEYLSDSPLMRAGTVIMGVITDMLRTHGYTEWDGTSGSIVGASYDWRMMPSQLEARDGFFSTMMEQVESMVATDPSRRAAVVIGFSLGCRIAKYFLHFCLAHRGRQWCDLHLAHFIPLGGPFLGSVQLLRAVLVDGTFAPLDMLFNESQMLTILRSVPVGRYLQPTGDWEDGLDCPFTFLREVIGGLG
eukprot:TRINITY_DN19191_c0_g2_i1.p1 TRINITY_DN19191_c0_g2~~TRINITY_DN19191_c0_g2_i1.p1  ORF type:complete len:261 (+),score=47.10 TRINITY_DN19191_c0_g2_i1:110-892(+)